MFLWVGKLGNQLQEQDYVVEGQTEAQGWQKLKLVILEDHARVGGNQAVQEGG